MAQQAEYERVRDIYKSKLLVFSLLTESNRLCSAAHAGDRVVEALFNALDNVGGLNLPVLWVDQARLKFCVSGWNALAVEANALARAAGEEQNVRSIYHLLYLPCHLHAAV